MVSETKEVGDQSIVATLTPWRIDVRDISIVGQTTCEQAHTRRATQGCGNKVIREGGALCGHVLHSQGRVKERVQLQILVIRHDEEKVWLCRANGIAGRILRKLSRRDGMSCRCSQK